MSTRAKLTIAIAVAGLVFVLGLTFEWWAAGLLALLCSAMGMEVRRRNQTPPPSPPPPSDSIEAIDDAIDDDITAEIPPPPDPDEYPDDDSDVVDTLSSWADDV